MSDQEARSAAHTEPPQRTAADIGYLRGLYEHAATLAPKYDGDLGPVTPQTRKIILSLLDELEAKLDA